jgi:hypothetical protein
MRSQKKSEEKNALNHQEGDINSGGDIFIAVLLKNKLLWIHRN